MFRKKTVTAVSNDSTQELIKLLEARAKEIEQFLKPEDEPSPLRELKEGITEKELLQFKKLLKDKAALEKAFDAVIDKSASELEAYGMQTVTDENSKTPERMNIFAKYPTSNVNPDGSNNSVDDSIFSKTENFGGVIRKAYDTTYVRDPSSGKQGLKRSQSNLFMVESYQSSTKPKSKDGQFANVPDKFMFDLINIRAKEVEILILAEQSAASIENTEKRDTSEQLTRAAMFAGNSLPSYQDLIDKLKSVQSYSQLMSVNDFNSVINLKDNPLKDHPYTKEIINELKLLNQTSQPASWLNKETVALSDQERLEHLAILKGYIRQLPAGVLTHPESKKCIDKLSEQIEYAKLKTMSALAKNAELEATVIHTPNRPSVG